MTRQKTTSWQHASLYPGFLFNYPFFDFEAQNKENIFLFDFKERMKIKREKVKKKKLNGSVERNKFLLNFFPSFSLK